MICMKKVSKKGIEKGIEKGIAKGDMHARRSVIVNLHNKGFGLTDIADMVQVRIETVKQCLAGVVIQPAK